MKVGDRIKITRHDSVHWYTGDRILIVDPMPITGTIIEKDLNHLEGCHARPLKVRFDDGRETWWDDWEMDKI
jgi:hypothetical protein